jgi:hypothetical protein|tara:strand:+ start:42 stop:503 length:462 start_codon:yes stop_codon:yes gene_type:complete
MKGFKRLKSWIKRYGFAEIFGTITAYLGFIFLDFLTGNNILAAYGGVIGENIGFYGTMFVRELMHDLSVSNKIGKRYSLVASFKTLKKLLTEFGPAETLDTFVIRPFTMNFGVKFLGKGIGIFAGKITADIIFYIPTIISFEIRKFLEGKNKG